MRPGEIDPNPESKPARPDPVDMDEDEKEMLSEARARLANTKGKKAKRKAREKQLEEARRLASLQKRRELKAAGIETVKRAKRVKGMDYNAEIPFERRPLPGVYTTKEEQRGRVRQLREEKFKPAMLADLDGRRPNDLEEQLLKQDVKRQRINERRNIPSAIQKVNQLNDALVVYQRVELRLPDPQNSIKDFKISPKLGNICTATDPSEYPNADGTLVSPQSQGQNQSLKVTSEARKGSSDRFDLSRTEMLQVSPRSAEGTVRLCTTPGMTACAHSAEMRDLLNINSPDALFSQRKSHLPDLCTPAALYDVKDDFSSLPAPTNEYHVVVPKLPGKSQSLETSNNPELVYNNEDDEARKPVVNVLSKYLQGFLLHRNSPSGHFVKREINSVCTSDSLIIDELRGLLSRDARALSEQGLLTHLQNGTDPLLSALEVETGCEMYAAAALIKREEAHIMKASNGHYNMLEGHGATTSSEWPERIFTPNERTGNLSAETVECVVALTDEHIRRMHDMERSAKRATKLEHKVSLLNAGLKKRSSELCVALNARVAHLNAAVQEHNAYSDLYNHELANEPCRLEDLDNLKNRTLELRTKNQGLWKHVFTPFG